MKSGQALKIIALVILGLMAAYWLFLAITAVMAGNTNAISTIVIMILTIIIGILSWRWPLPGGIALVILAVGVAMYFLLTLYYYQDALPILLRMCLPTAFSGWLFIEADWRAREQRSKGPTARMP